MLSWSHVCIIFENILRFCSLPLPESENLIFRTLLAIFCSDLKHYAYLATLRFNMCGCRYIYIWAERCMNDSVSSKQDEKLNYYITRLVVSFIFRIAFVKGKISKWNNIFIQKEHLSDNSTRYVTQCGFNGIPFGLLTFSWLFKEYRI